jgi:general secretion pathway protein M
MSWLANLGSRDRLVLLAGAIVVGTALFWVAIWEPLAQSRTSLATQASNAEADLAWMRGTADTLRTLRGSATADVFERGGQSLLALADATAREAGLGAALKRVEPVPNSQRVNVWFEAANFDQLASWLEDLSRRFGVGVDELSVDRLPGVGVVSARVTLADAPAR